jgi:hypothetical protein
MKALTDPSHALGRGLSWIRGHFQVPEAFPETVLAAAAKAAKRAPTQHVDRTNYPSVTLDPVSSTDLDQAFAIEREGADLLLRYAIADVAWFVENVDSINQKAWRGSVACGSGCHLRSRHGAPAPTRRPRSGARNLGDHQRSAGAARGHAGVR